MIEVVELTIEYWNKLAHQIIFISSLLGGFSIAVVANLLVSEKNNQISNYTLKAATIAAACFLVAIFAMTNIFMKTTPGYPINITESDLFIPRIVGFITYTLGIVFLIAVISLAGWSKSKRIGWFTTIVGIITFLIIMMMLST